MKRFGRLAIEILTVMSAVLFVANAAWWVRSYFMADVLLHLATDKPAGVPTTGPATPYVGRRILALAPMRGRVQVGYTRESYAHFTLVPDGWMRQSVPTRLVMGIKAPWKTLGFGYSHDVLPATVVLTENGVPVQGPAAATPLAEAWNVWVPCWFIALLTVLLPVMWFRAWTARYHSKR
jgi:hypothetical protein